MSNPPETTSFVRKRLPHWEVFDGRYFVTLCRRGAIPPHAAAKIRRMRQPLESLQGGPLLEQRRQIFREMETWLDRAETVRDLVSPGLAAMLREAIGHRVECGEWAMFGYVIMPSHIHLFIKPLKQSLITSISAFKKWTGHQARQKLGSPRENFWAREWFDHWSRSPEEDARIVRYIRQNPVKTGLARDYQDWPYGSWPS
jgi:REP element-mobilizing transposase RayT